MTATPNRRRSTGETRHQRPLAAVFALVLLGAFACRESPPETAETAAPAQPSNTTPSTPPAHEAVPDAPPRLVHRSRPIMGTVFRISVAGLAEEEASPLIDRALDEIDRLEAVLSEWQPDSEISQINDQAGAAPVSVSQDTLRVVEAGIAISRWSGGAFDLSWAALRGLYQFGDGRERVPPLTEVRTRLRLVDWQAISVDREAGTVRLTRPGMSIGTGSIGKGYALDRAGRILRNGGAENYMLFGGGQVQVHGERGGRPWRIGIQHPRDPDTYIGFLELNEGSISTSGDYEHAFVDNRGRHWHHLIDLETGLPARRSMQVTTVANQGIYADAVSTAIFILGPQRAFEMLERLGTPTEAIVIGPDLRIWSTPAIRERLVMSVALDHGRLRGSPRFGSR